MIEYIVAVIFFLLALLLGYFVSKALQAERFRELQDQLKNFQETKNKLATAERNLIVSKVERDKFQESEEKIKADYFRLTLSYKNLQEEVRREQTILKQQYEVPPEIPRLKESNRLLSIEIERLRSKLRKWKSQNLVKENKKLRKKLKKANVMLEGLQKVQLTQQDLEKYESLYFKIRSLGEEAEVLLRQQNKETELENDEDDREGLGIFSQQPEISKKMIFQSIIGKDNNNQRNIVYDLDEPSKSLPEKGLMDLIDLDAKAYAVLINAGIETFEDLVDTKIKDLKLLLEIAEIDTQNYKYASWPLQARLAQKGDWELIEEFRNR